MEEISSSSIMSDGAETNGGEIFLFRFNDNGVVVLTGLLCFGFFE